MQTVSALELLDTVNNMVQDFISTACERVPAKDLGLDERCGSVYVNVVDEVIIATNSRSIDYYGGFEYIREGEGRTTLGDYVFYSECDRVQDCFDSLRDKVEDEA